MATLFVVSGVLAVLCLAFAFLAFVSDYVPPYLTKRWRKAARRRHEQRFWRGVS
jgi:hypothetical protein